ncbi:MAG: choice-of-anchor B family protein [Candidatus Promineifilaceae bacterium]
MKNLSPERLGRPRPRLAFSLLALILLAAAALLSGGRLAAQEGGDLPAPDEVKENVPLTRAMQALLERKVPVQDLAPMGATPCVGGMAGPYPCDNVDLLAFLPLGNIGGGSGNDSWGWTDSLDGKEYALMGRSSGTSFVDITDPVNPIYLGNLPTHTSNSDWRDIKVYSNYAFIVSEASGHGMQVFDLTELRSVPAPPVTFSETAHYPGFGHAHNLAINEESGYAYGVGTSTCSGGLHMVNIQDPLNPTNAGCFGADLYTHDAQCVNYIGPDPDYDDKEICFNSNEDTVTIVDVTNKADPQLIVAASYPGSGYTHQGWLTPDHVYFLLDDEVDELNFGHNTRTRMWDMSDLDAPVLIDFFDSTSPAIDHNQYVHQGYTYQANYTSGLRILDLADIANGNLSQFGFFDIYPSHDNPIFAGSWSNYPYYASGNVIISGMESGLFIVRPTFAPDFSLTADPTALTVCGDASDSSTIDLTASAGYTGTVTLSTAGLPAGATPAFAPNPVDPPATSTLTVSTSGVSSGSYPFDVIGDDGAISHTVGLELSVYDAAPGAPTLVAPADGAADVSPAPLFEWTAAAQADSYTLEVASDAGFGNIVYQASVAGTSHQMTTGLEPLTLYYWRVRAVNPCGEGPNSAAFSFTTLEIPPILLVDDDDNSPDVRADYTAALDTLVGLTGYDIWDTENSDDEPSAAELAPYDIVIWFSGEEFGGAAGPGSAGETALITWLDGGGCFMISSQDYHYDRGLTPFMDTYLGVTSVEDDTSQDTVTGQGAVFGGLGPYSLNYPFVDFSDVITPDPAAEVAFLGNNGNAAVDKDGGAYRTSYWGFPFEAIPTSTDQQESLLAFLDWCAGATQVGTLAVSAEAVELSVQSGLTATATLVISNTGTADFDFATAIDVAWASVEPVSGTLAPGESLELTLTFDAAAAGPPGDYSGELTFSGTFGNVVPPVVLILHVTDGPPPGDQFFIYLPAIFGS